MTNKEYFISQLGYTPTILIIEGLLLNAGFTGTDIYVAENATGMKYAILEGLKHLLSTPDITQGTGETSNSIKYDRNAILQRIRDLEGELGITSKPTIKGINVW